MRRLALWLLALSLIAVPADTTPAYTPGDGYLGVWDSGPSASDLSGEWRIVFRTFSRTAFSKTWQYASGEIILTANASAVRLAVATTSGFRSMAVVDDGSYCHMYAGGQHIASRPHDLWLVAVPAFDIPAFVRDAFNTLNSTPSGVGRIGLVGNAVGRKAQRVLATRDDIRLTFAYWGYDTLPLGDRVAWPYYLTPYGYMPNTSANLDVLMVARPTADGWEAYRSPRSAEDLGGTLWRFIGGQVAMSPVRQPTEAYRQLADGVWDVSGRLAVHRFDGTYRFAGNLAATVKAYTLKVYGEALGVPAGQRTPITLDASRQVGDIAWRHAVTPVSLHAEGGLLLDVQDYVCLYGKPLATALGKKPFFGYFVGYSRSTALAAGQLRVIAVRQGGYFALTVVGYVVQMAVWPKIPLAVHEYLNGQPRRSSDGYLGVRLLPAGGG